MIYERYLKKRKRDRREQSGLEKLGAKRLTVEEIVNEVASTYHVAVRELYQKRSSQAEARSMVIELCRTCLSRKMSMSALGERLGGISVSAISQNSGRLKEKIRKDKRLQRKYYGLMKRINGE
jgi:chromosomal replication initiation ATPase DnaA